MKHPQKRFPDVLSEKIFLDRYALKKDLKQAKPGDRVLVTLSGGKYPVKAPAVLRQLPETFDKPATSGEMPDANYIVEMDDGQTAAVRAEQLVLPAEAVPEQLWDRLAAEIASVERNESMRSEWTGEFRSLLDDWAFVPGGRIAAGAGSDSLTMFNCYVIPSPQDSRGGILDTLRQMTEIMSRGGGVGINLSSLRPNRAPVKGVNGHSSGAVSWGGLYSYATGLIEQGGSRRGALMLMLDDWHPDVAEFITIKQTMHEMTNANLSVCVSDRFMDAVKQDQSWTFEFPDTAHPDYNTHWNGDLTAWRQRGYPVIPYRTVRARELWEQLTESAWRSAEPGVVFMERYQRMSNSWYFNRIVSTNPCGEQGLPPWGVCNLAALNLGKFYDPDTNAPDWPKLANAVRVAVRFLDNVIDRTAYHFEENRANQMRERRIGLGSMGLAELLIRMGVRYGSDRSLDVLDELFAFLAKEAYLASSALAAEKGSFPAFEAERLLHSGFMKSLCARFPEVEQAVRTSGLRNVTLLTQAPTGSTGTMVGTSTGIEPFFAFEFVRQSRLGTDQQDVGLAADWKAANPGQPLPEYFVSAMQLTAEEHIRVQAAIQRWVDSSISKTANCPNETTVEETRRLYELAYDLGCKGVTIYRDGSRNEQVLHTAATEQAKTTYRQRPPVLKGSTYRMNTPLGMAYITINDLDGVPAELFLNVGKAGSDVSAMAEALGRVSSLFLRYGDHRDKAKLLIKHLRGIGGTQSAGFGEAKVESIADAVAKALIAHVENQLPLPDSNAGPDIHRSENHDDADYCPSCGSATLLRLEGCHQCSSCGFSRCG